MEIHFGDRIRTFDRDRMGIDASFLEGVVEGFHGRTVFIRVTRMVHRGTEMSVSPQSHIHLPVDKIGEWEEGTDIVVEII